MKIISLLLLVPFLISCEGPNQNVQSEKEKKPNIIILLADDLGYGDLSCYGSQSLETPNLDKLAASGMRFTSFYAGSAVCSPSRACLLTGKFPLRFNIRRHFKDSTDHLPARTATLPKILKKEGYTTAHIGKWHLGGLRMADIEQRKAGKTILPGPLEHGFDHYLCNIEGAPVRPALIRERQLYRSGGKYMISNDSRLPPSSKHWTEIKVDEAIRLTEDFSDSDQPFFINMWFDVPHTPYEPAPEPHLSKYAALGAEGDQLYFRSMVSHLDAQIGRLVDHLKEKNLFNNTIIIFTSDNGPAYQGSPGPFKGGKTDLHEGGIRVPMFAVWQDVIPANSHNFHSAHMADLLPTICEAIGIDPGIPDLDGKSILHELRTGAQDKQKPMLWQMDLYTHFQNQGPKPTPFATGVVINGKWKLLADSLKATELFNLEQDHRELYNLLDTHPYKADSMINILKTFYQDDRVRWQDDIRR